MDTCGFRRDVRALSELKNDKVEMSRGWMPFIFIFSLWKHHYKSYIISVTIEYGYDCSENISSRDVWNPMHTLHTALIQLNIEYFIEFYIEVLYLPESLQIRHLLIHVTPATKFCKFRYIWDFDSSSHSRQKSIFLCTQINANSFPPSATLMYQNKRIFNSIYIQTFISDTINVYVTMTPLRWLFTVF